MKDRLIEFETAKLAQEKGFDWPCNIVFDLKNNDIEVDFYEQACLEFIGDCETGYRDKALNYFREDYKRTDDNTDFGYYITRPTQSLLQTWLRTVHNIVVQSRYEHTTSCSCDIECKVELFRIDNELGKCTPIFTTYKDTGFKTPDDAIEIGLQEALKLIKDERKN